MKTDPKLSILISDINQEIEGLKNTLGRRLYREIHVREYMKLSPCDLKKRIRNSLFRVSNRQKFICGKLVSASTVSQLLEETREENQKIMYEIDEEWDEDPKPFSWESKDPVVKEGVWLLDLDIREHIYPRDVLMEVVFMQMESIRGKIQKWLREREEQDNEPNQYRLALQMYSIQLYLNYIKNQEKQLEKQLELNKILLERHLLWRTASIPWDYTIKNLLFL